MDTQIQTYRRLIEMQRANDDPLLMVRIADLTALLDYLETHRPRVRVRAGRALVEHEVAE